MRLQLPDQAADEAADETHEAAQMHKSSLTQSISQATVHEANQAVDAHELPLTGVGVLSGAAEVIPSRHDEAAKHEGAQAHRRGGGKRKLQTVHDLARMLAQRTPGFTGADLTCVCQRAAIVALQRRGMHLGSGRAETGSEQSREALWAMAGYALPSLTVSVADFEQALEDTQPSVSKAMLLQLQQWRESRGSSRNIS